MTNRLDKLRTLLAANKSLPMIYTDMSDIYYLSMFSGSTAYIILTEEDNIFITDSRYETQIDEEIDQSWTKVIVSSYLDYFKDFAKCSDSIYISNKSSLNLYSQMAQVTTATIDTANSIDNLRCIKDELEIEDIKHSYLIAAKAFHDMMRKISYTQSEKEWRAELEYFIKKNGGEKESFDTIVASGFRGALPHGIASNKKINESEPVIIDYGCKQRYCSDITRMVYSGKDTYIKDVIQIVSDAVDLGIENIKSGIACSEIDKTVRNFISQKGYGEYFKHSLGHSIGIDVHEKPSLNIKDDTIIEKGMIFTIEPGIYLPGRFGVRIEETVLITENGCEILSSVLKDRLFTL